MRKIFFILLFVILLKPHNLWADSLLLKEAEKYYQQGEKEFKLGNFEEAKKYFQKALAINPNLTNACYYLDEIAKIKGEAEIISPLLEYPREKEKIIQEAKEWEKELVGKKEVFISTPEEISLEEPSAIKGNYTGITSYEIYKAEKRGPTIITRLDPYHPEHKDFKIPYYKDREGLKITPIVGIRGEYMVNRELPGIECLIQEAQEFNQRNIEQAKQYLSINDKEYHREEIILHYKETWPKFTYTYHEERARREYDARTIWGPDKVYYDNYNKRYYQIEHAIPGIKNFGSLRWKFRYGDEVGYKPNDPAGYKEIDSYLFGLETNPYFPLLGTFGAKIEFTYMDKDYSHNESLGLAEQWAKERDFFVELDFYYPEKFLRIKPHFFYKKERLYPDYNTWYDRKNGVKVEKDLNGKIKFISDWTYMDYARDKNPFLASATHLSASCWKLENDLEYEFIRDWKLKFGYDYGNALGFSLFDYYTLRSELQYKKPGLGEFRLGYGLTRYYKLDDEVNTFLFKLGLFI